MDIVLDWSGVQVLQFVIAILLPLLVGLVTKEVTSSGIKAVLLVALSALTAFCTSWLNAAQQNMSFDLGAALFAFLATFLVGVAVQFGFWKPVGATALVQNTLVTSSSTPVDPDLDTDGDSDTDTSGEGES